MTQLICIAIGVVVIAATFFSREPHSVKVTSSSSPLLNVSSIPMMSESSPFEHIASQVISPVATPATSHVAETRTTDASVDDIFKPVVISSAEAAYRILASPVAEVIVNDDAVASSAISSAPPVVMLDALSLDELFQPNSVSGDSVSSSDSDIALATQQLEYAASIAAEKPFESLALCLGLTDLCDSEKSSSPNSVSPNSAAAPSATMQQSHLLRALLLGLRVAEPVLTSLPAIESVAVSQSGRFIVVACRNGAVKLWDAQRREVKTLTQTSARVVSLCVTVDERFVVAGRADGTVTWWWIRSVPEQTELNGFTLPIVVPGLCKVALSPDGLWMLAFNSGTAASSTAASGATANRDFRNRAAEGDAQCWLWNIASVAQCRRLADVAVWHQPIRLRGHTRPVTSFAFCRYSRWLVIGSEDGSARIYDLTTPVTGIGLSAIKEAHAGSVLSIAIAPDHSWIATGGDDNKIRLWGLKNGAAVPLATLTGHRGWVTALLALPNSQTLISGGLDQQLLAWDVGTTIAATSITPTVLATHIGGIRSIEISPDNSFLAVLSGTSSLQLWRIGSDSCIADPITLSPRGAAQFPIADIHFDANNRLIQAVPQGVAGSSEWAVQRLPLNRDEMITLAREVVNRVAATTPEPPRK